MAWRDEFPQVIYEFPRQVSSSKFPRQEAALNAVASSTEAIALRLWAYEIRNCILTGMRWGRITQPNRGEFLKSLSDLNIALSDPVSYNQVFSLASRYKLTVYDAAYLDPAIKESLAVASLDKELLRADEQAGLAPFKTWRRPVRECDLTKLSTNP